MSKVTSSNIEDLSLCETAVHQRMDALQLHEDAGCCTLRDYEHGLSMVSRLTMCGFLNLGSSDRGYRQPQAMEKECPIVTSYISAVSCLIQEELIYYTTVALTTCGTYKSCWSLMLQCIIRPEL